MPTESDALETVVLIVSILAMKIVALVIGYLIIKLGYNALVRGIKGEFDFQGKLRSDLEFKLVGSSPGVFLTLLGTVVICWTLFVGKPVYWDKSLESLIESISNEHNQPSRNSTQGRSSDLTDESTLEPMLDENVEGDSL